MWYVYIIKCVDGALYTGVTTDIDHRVKRHNARKASKYTRIRTPVTLAYSEKHLNHSSALKREAQIKRWPRQKKITLIKGDFFRLNELSRSRD